MRVLIIGGYGNFGAYIASSLAKVRYIQVIIAGRNLEKAKKAAEKFTIKNKIEAYKVDTNYNLLESLAVIKPDLVIHTSGPFQGQPYTVAEACIKQKCHYVDLADARDFVNNINTLEKKAQKADVLICSGASSVPCLTSSIIDKYSPQFKNLEKVEYAIATAQLTNRGLATIESVLSYAGKPFKTLINGKMHNVYGWLGVSFRNFWGLKNRALSYCDIPDLEIFPKRYPSLKTIVFKAGLELKILHLILALLSWFIKIGIFKSLQPLAPIMLKISYLFDRIGNDDSGFYMTLSGKDKNGIAKEINFEILAINGAGLFIPCIPSIIIAKKLANKKLSKTGAQACVGLITLDEYLNEFSELNIDFRVS